MPTIKQKRALDKLVENGGNVSRAILEANYSPATAKTPQKLTESDGFKALCEEYGLTDDLLIKSLVSDIRKKPKNRKAELELGFKVRNRLKERDEERPNPIVIGFNFIANDQNNNADDKTNIKTGKMLGKIT